VAGQAGRPVELDSRSQRPNQVLRPPVCLEPDQREQGLLRMRWYSDSPPDAAESASPPAAEPEVRRRPARHRQPALLGSVRYSGWPIEIARRPLRHGCGITPSPALSVGKLRLTIAADLAQLVHGIGISVLLRQARMAVRDGADSQATCLSDHPSPCSDHAGRPSPRQRRCRQRDRPQPVRRRRRRRFCCPSRSTGLG